MYGKRTLDVATKTSNLTSQYGRGLHTLIHIYTHEGDINTHIYPCIYNVTDMFDNTAGRDISHPTLQSLFPGPLWVIAYSENLLLSLLGFAVYDGDSPISWHNSFSDNTAAL